MFNSLSYFCPEKTKRERKRKSMWIQSTRTIKFVWDFSNGKEKKYIERICSYNYVCNFLSCISHLHRWFFLSIFSNGIEWIFPSIIDILDKSKFKMLYARVICPIQSAHIHVYDEDKISMTSFNQFQKLKTCAKGRLVRWVVKKMNLIG